ncbi:PepSY-associated TM helix domain-containing protein [Nevskia ramosa]|uniref:PepSY-associated TM helix domain-containing protein n=1 Tax=Nevskia ramosa TaxID=64002 RepID=UPI002353393D|nr:PepSY domain-containing protein [Nevskia ramosa]
MTVQDDSDTALRGSLYAQVWRWHFYAGLFAAPFLLILAITGAIYLFNDELNDLIYPELRFAASPAASLPPSRLVAAGNAAFVGGEVTRIDLPTEPGRTAQLFVRLPVGQPARRVFVDPATAQVLGSYVYTDTLVGFADVAHGSLLLGDVGDAIVELASCWAVVLIGTGLYLWWPRGRERFDGVLVPRLRATGRRFWRDLHKVSGLYASALILFLLITGLPWATIWGDRFLRPISDALAIGYPRGDRHNGGARSHLPAATMGAVAGEVPWTLQKLPLPASQAPHTGAGHEEHMAAAIEQPAEALPPGIDLDTAVAILATHGFVEAYRLSLPQGLTGTYTAYTYPAQPEGQRNLHLDRYSGAVLAEAGFGDYGPLARLIEWGVAIHLGNYFGLANQLLMLLTCVFIVLLVATGLVMWWRRRPAGGLGAPRALAPLQLRNAALITLGLSLLFPLAGASLLGVLLIDALLRRIAATTTISEALS